MLVNTVNARVSVRTYVLPVCVHTYLLPVCKHMRASCVHMCLCTHVCFLYACAHVHFLCARVSVRFLCTCLTWYEQACLLARLHTGMRYHLNTFAVWQSAMSYESTVTAYWYALALNRELCSGACTRRI